jgi:hypothetical protein
MQLLESHFIDSYRDGVPPFGDPPAQGARQCGAGLRFFATPPLE